MDPKKKQTQNRSKKVSKDPAVNSDTGAISNQDIQLEVFFKQSLDGFFFMDIATPIDWNDSIDKEKALKRFYTEQKVTKVNKAFLDQYGANEKDIMGISPADFFHHNPQHGLDVCREILILGHTTIITDERKIDGTQIWIEGNYFLFKNSKDQITGLFGIQRDITERKQAEVDLREREESYKELFNSISDAIYILDRDGYLLEVNKGAQLMYGYSREELIGKTLSFLSPKKSNDLIIVNNFLRETFSTGRTSQFDFYGLRKNNEIFPKNIIFNRGKYNGKEVVFAIGRDISDRKKAEEKLRESEERFRRIYEDAPIGIFRTTHDGKILITNPALVKMLGYDSFEELNSLDIEKELYASNFSRKDFTNSLEKKGSVAGLEFLMKRKDGSLIHVRENARVVKDTSGRVMYYEGTIEDISDRKLAEEKLIASEKQLRETNIMKDKFFSIIAHDLRSPFQGLLGISSILSEEDDLTIEERVLYAKKLNEGLKTQYSLLDDLLAWSRLQRGVMEYKPEESIPREDIEEVLNPFNTTIEKKNILLTFVCEETLSAKYDRNMFGAVIRNLVSNAIKFTPDNGSIFLNAIQTDKDLVISVTDNGIGISKEDLPKLFRIDSHFIRRGTHDEGGSGLGLVLCKEFIEKHGGKLWVESAVNVGSTFSFSIPKN
ncbi:MAG: PAS domain S-box protein [Ignavibacteria bacterium]|nr:PAS domain S-box protein [Ignavibacteria bacterium]